MFADMSQFSSKWETVLFAIVHFLFIIQRRAITQPMKLCWTIFISPIMPLLIDFKRQVDYGAINQVTVTTKSTFFILGVVVFDEHFEACLQGIF